jgi:hypothetical protein
MASRASTLEAASAVRAWLITAALTYLAIAAGCPAKTERAGTDAADRAIETKRSNDVSGAPANEALTDSPEATSPPSVSDYFTGKAGNTTVVNAAGFVMPRGWPIPELTPPPDALPLGEAVSAASWGGGAVQWSQGFDTETHWNDLVADVEKSLSGKFQRVRGAKLNDPDLDEHGKPKMGHTRGDRAYRSLDGRTAVFVRGEFSKQPSKPKGPTREFLFQIVIFDAPTPVGPNTKLEDI